MALAIEYYNRSFTADNAGASGPLPLAQYLEMSNVDGLQLGTRLFLGPSSDPDNLEATEVVHVSSVVWYATEYRVYLKSPVQNQYKIGDSISLYTHFYLYSQIAYGGSLDSGTIYKFNAYSWNKVEADSKGIYKRVTAARWCPTIRGIASIIGSNMLFIRPYESYSNWRSLFLKNYEYDTTTFYEVYDVIFKDYSIYKLQDKTTLRGDTGSKQTFNWDTYNYQEDTLFPYSDSINMWMSRSILMSYWQYEAINIQVRDQYHISLRDVNVNLYIEPGDIGAILDPLDGYGITDVNGKLVIHYLSGTSYEGHTVVKGRADKSSTSTGSEFVWNSNSFISKLSYDEGMGLITKVEVESTNSVKQIGEWFEEYRGWKRSKHSVPDGKSVIDWYKPDVWLIQRSYFTSPGGDWVSVDSDDSIPLNLLEEWLPMFYTGVDQLDTPMTGKGCAYPFVNWSDGSNSYCGIIIISEPYPICNQVKVVRDFESENKVELLTDFLIYEWVRTLVEGELKMILMGIPPYVLITLPDDESSLQISQLKLSKHTHYVDGQPYDYLWVYDNIDQFIFVEDAIPKFWSEKNPINTDIWIRLRPFVHSLDDTSLRMWIREVSYMGDTGYYEVTDQLVLTPFDAGGFALGVEVLYNPINDFHHNALVFVRIEVYDISPIPNSIETEYWFHVVPDYKTPYLVNLLPGREEDFVDINTDISFEIKDNGAGIDIDTLECFFNSIRMHPDDLVIEKYSRYHYKVIYTPPENLYYDKQYKIGVKVSDSAPAVNKLNDAWVFYTKESSGVMFTGFYPIHCKRGASKFSSVSVLALGAGDGVDKGTLVLQVLDRDVSINKIPIVYRIS